MSKPAFKVSWRSIVEDLDTGAVCLELVFTKHDGGSGRLIVPMSHRQQPSRVTNMLLDAGARLPTAPDQANEVVAKALRAAPTRLCRVTSRAGWVDDAFVLPFGTVGKAEPQIRFTPSSSTGTALGAEGGGLAEWLDGLDEACDASDILIFAIAAAFAAPLLRFVPEREGAVFALLGPTSTGKTLALLAAASVAGLAKRTQAPTLDVTARGLEELANAYNDLLLPLDEAARIAPNTREQRHFFTRLAHTLPSGTGRRRSRSVAAALPSLTWQVITLVTGEMPVADLGSELNGERVRLIGIPVPGGDKGGIFNRMTEPSDGAARALAAQVENTVATNFGVALRSFLTHVIADLNSAEVLVGLAIDEFVVRSGAQTSFERRLAAKFGLIMAAARMAFEAGVAPWERERAEDAVLDLYHDARAAIETPDDRVNRLLERVRETMKDRGKFPRVKKGQSVDPDPAVQGYLKTVDGEKIVALDPDWIRRVVGSQHVHAVIKAFKGKNVVIPGPDGKSTRQIKIPGLDKRKRFLCLKRAAL
ncbi:MULTISPECIES: DUF927 domain-containing protein [unclassified Chelatococcus]|uniref:DUF927 domain-containing protein n=1 Tax=unclassified Chelatococcus TaxID=2638111 RepID=UPI001BCE9A4E|nr:MULTISPECIES: DUF927 domain-containing protein [unclassified Chelatococcus]CAH1654887.1 putative Superfamily II helicase and inactivated derivatives-like protein [Hyphomicrobiales bacterium]MBS7740310.1 DUF927 domain-containing protein [Chelatococcus sp. HY11]MBX3544860.1 DUF927 domain-containing protein [Chelatococcus sp.]MCO5078449.1 DUF927 domain-containing protein [Chelatococcus sp.]CAH1685280.1 putative Superfamily II helicase and inactivated derivatives-like protein [Hyphomicrobiales 